MQDITYAQQPTQLDRPAEPGTDVATLAAEILALESETFEITDYSDASEVMLGSSTSCSSTSTCSSTTSTTSCSA
jgi:thiazolylpeptide-type bacteriocin precursor